jgi:hypothetical protein
MRSTELLAQAAKNKLAKTSIPTGITFISIVNQHDEEPRAAQSTPENPERLQPPRHSRLNNRPSGNRTTKNIWRNGPLTVSENETSQNGTGVVRNF